MGGLKKYMPSTRWTFLIATLAIAGLPGLSGFFSKDEILFKAFAYGYDGHFIGLRRLGVGIVTALLTAIYMTRAYLLTFEGDPRWPDSLDTHPHESPWTMTTPLWILAGLSVVAGFLGSATGRHRVFRRARRRAGSTTGSASSTAARSLSSLTRVKPSHAVGVGTCSLSAAPSPSWASAAWFGLRYAQRGA